MLLQFLSLLGLINSPDPEQWMSSTEVIAYYGYPVETHNVTTDDGYILTIHRIPYGRNGQLNGTSRGVVYLQHGLLDSDWIFLSNLPDNSLAFVLADAGFDVWMGNSRGNLYSLNHVNLSYNDPEYWKFSWDEMARFDLPATIDYVLNQTNSSQLNYVGHSQGTLILFANAVQESSIAGKIKHFFALAPILTTQHVKSDISQLILDLLPILEFVPLNDKLLFGEPIALSPCCGTTLLGICSLITSEYFGKSDQVNKSRLPVFMSKFPGGTSRQNMEHFNQMREQTAYFDFGESENLERYRQSSPPHYNFTKFSIPTTIFHSPSDNLADADDVNILLNTIHSSSIVNAYNLPGFSHVDYLNGERANAEVYEKILQFIEQ